MNRGLLLLTLGIICACGSTPEPPTITPQVSAVSGPKLYVQNDSTTAIDVTAGSSEVVTVGCGASRALVLSGTPPWRVVVRGRASARAIFDANETRSVRLLVNDTGVVAVDPEGSGPVPTPPICGPAGAVAP